VGPLLDQIQDIEQVTADGAYDGAPTYQTVAQHGAHIRIVIPPICGRPPWQALFWRFERFGRLRSYVRPVDAEHMSAGLDGVRLSGSLSCERALRSWGVAGCS